MPEGAVYKVRHGEAIEFTLGAGAPLFPPRGAHRGLIVYITVCEADEGVRHIGEVMQSVHAELTREDSVVGIVKSLIANPSKVVADNILAAATAALQPIATILRNNGDDYEALFTGVPRQGPVDGPAECAAERGDARAGRVALILDLRSSVDDSASWAEPLSIDRASSWWTTWERSIGCGERPRWRGAAGIGDLG